MIGWPALEAILEKFHGEHEVTNTELIRLRVEVRQTLANQEKIMDDIAAAVAAMNEAAAVLQAHVAASAEPVDLSGLREATAALNTVLHPASEPTPAEVTVPDPLPVNGDPGPDITPAVF